MKRLRGALVGLGLALTAAVVSAAEPQPARRDTAADGSPRCVYSTYQWDVAKQRAARHRKVDKPYIEVSKDERDPADPRCTPCRGDQTTIDPARYGWPKVKAFSVCWAYADQVGKALQAIADAKDFDLREVTGWRVGRTRGAVVDGLRTGWSNHSFGTAVDINAAHNGLYTQCDIQVADPQRIRRCKLRVGGPWDPVARPRLTVTATGSVFQAFAAFWKWGGQIRGDIRDLMHFSIDGY